MTSMRREFPGAVVDRGVVEALIAEVTAIIHETAREQEREIDAEAEAAAEAEAIAGGYGFISTADHVRATLDNPRPVAVSISSLEAADGTYYSDADDEHLLELFDTARYALVSISGGVWEHILLSINKYTNGPSSIEVDSSWIIGTRILEAASRLLASGDGDTGRPGGPLNIFIGHGGDRKWEIVRDYLIAAGHEVHAFESSDRTGIGTLEVVYRLIRDADIAVIVMTAVDSHSDGSKHARQNVVHELGLAQGIHGHTAPIILKEDSATEFSNIAGVTQIRFPDGEIHLTKDAMLSAVENRGRRPRSGRHHW